MSTARLFPLALAVVVVALVLGVTVAVAGPGLGVILPAHLQYYHTNVTNPPTPDLIAAQVLNEWAAAAAEVANSARHGRLINMNLIGPSTENAGTANPVNSTHTLYFNPGAGGGVLAITTYFPGTGLSQGFDIAFIDGDVTWRVGNQFDLRSVTLHEFGHAIGLAHNPDPSAVLFANYQGIRWTWAQADITCIQNLGYPVAACTVTGVTPGRVPSGTPTLITVTGTGFVPGTNPTVTVGGMACSGVSVVNSTTITCTTVALPPGNHTCTVTGVGGNPVCSRPNAVTTFPVPALTSTPFVLPNTTVTLGVTYPGGNTSTGCYFAGGLTPSGGIPIAGMDGLLLLADPLLLFSGNLDATGRVTFLLPIGGFSGFFFVYWQALVVHPATAPVFSNRATSAFSG